MKITSSLQKNPRTVGVARYLTMRMGEPTMTRMVTSSRKDTGNAILAMLTSMWGGSKVLVSSGPPPKPDFKPYSALTVPHQLWHPEQVKDYLGYITV